MLPYNLSFATKSDHAAPIRSTAGFEPKPALNSWNGLNTMASVACVFIPPQLFEKAGLLYLTQVTSVHHLLGFYAVRAGIRAATSSSIG
jgi:hypothetical protein